MIDMPFQEFIENNRKEVRLVIVAGVYTDGAPDVESYKQSFYNIYQEMQKYGAEDYTIDAGFVEKSEDISDYIRTAGVNNIAWSNLKAKVYGQLNIDERLNPKNADPDIAEEYILIDPDAVVRNYDPYKD
jgi:hypothetical protein